MQARGKARWFMVSLLALVVASFWSLDLQWRAFLSLEAAASMARFIGEFFPPDLSAPFVRKVAVASMETLAMSALGTLRAIPELVWAALLLISAGLGPFAGTLALALHTTGVLGRLFAEAAENAPPGPGFALRAQGVGAVRVFLYATLPQVLPQLVSYTLYRWENNIRAAAVLGVVGAGGLGQMLAFHMGLFHMGKTATVLGAMLLLVALVDALSYGVRRRLMR
jgi:phosphonate transport system permease protein